MNSKGHILGDCRITDISTASLIKIPDMLVKRVGHSLVYVPPTAFWSEAPKGYVYIIGGRTSNNFRTKLCERYNIQT